MTPTLFFFLSSNQADVPLQWSALAGAMAGAAYWGIPYPMDTVKSKLQSDARFHGQPMLDVARAIVREEGVVGLYRGVSVTCARAMPSHALIFYFYALVDKLLEKY